MEERRPPFLSPPFFFFLIYLSFSLLSPVVVSSLLISYLFLSISSSLSPLSSLQKQKKSCFTHTILIDG
ncbi:hypothetical protein L6452_20797 [Arctium lappa]|uniref:Uncharacterized protein n=1 Tax=Arctium lappa TaxID=4217 RepID=A0ACB9BDN4_ARCLA|nr:hypothetical protein L6452_20797 [Arctium lappa]